MSTTLGLPRGSTSEIPQALVHALYAIPHLQSLLAEEHVGLVGQPEPRRIRVLPRLRKLLIEVVCIHGASYARPILELRLRYLPGRICEQQQPYERAVVYFGAEVAQYPVRGHYAAATGVLDQVLPLDVLGHGHHRDCPYVVNAPVDGGTRPRIPLEQHDLVS